MQTDKIIIDVSNLAYKSYYGNEDLVTTTGLKSGHVFGSIRTLLYFSKLFSDDIVLYFCYDGNGARQARQTILPSYKGNRQERDFNPIPEVKELLYCLPGVHIEQEHREGDDAVAYAVDKIRDKCIIYTSDKDLWALIDDNVKVYSPNKGRVVEKADWMAEYHVEDPAKIPISKALFGDKSDNIIGVERLIKKQVEPILNDPKCLDIETFYDMLQTQPESMTDKMYQKVMENKDRVMMNYRVVKPMISDFTKRAVTRTTKSIGNRDKLFELLKKFECYSVLADAERLYL